MKIYREGDEEYTNTLTDYIGVTSPDVDGKGYMLCDQGKWEIRWGIRFHSQLVSESQEHVIKLYPNGMFFVFDTEQELFKWLGDK